MKYTKISFTILILLAVLLWAIIPLCFKYSCPLFPWPGIFGNLSNYENAFAPVNALFSGLAFAGLVYTIYIQQRDSTVQHFQNVFFQLLHIHIENSKNFNPLIKERKLHGHEAFEALYTRLSNLYTYDQKPSTVVNTSKEDYKLYQDCKEKFKNYSGKSLFLKIFCEYHKFDFSSYFRHLYHIVKTIDQSPLSFSEKKNYIGILRAQLSSYEHALLYYTTLYRTEETGTGKFKKYIEKYALLHEINFNLLFDDEKVGKYENSAFGDTKSIKQ